MDTNAFLVIPKLRERLINLDLELEFWGAVKIEPPPEEASMDVAPEKPKQKVSIGAVSD